MADEVRLDKQFNDRWRTLLSVDDLVGAVVGAALGTIGFGLVGSFAGSEGGGVMGKELYIAIDECINKPPVPTFERVE